MNQDQLLGCSEADLLRAAKAIANGSLVALPTETVYGLGADAFNTVALARVFEAKARPRFDPLIVHIAAFNDLSRVADLSVLNDQAADRARLLIKKLWPGPLTLILPKQASVPDLATSGLATVAVRFPSHPVTRRIIELSGTVVAAPSANPFGYLSPTRVEHVIAQLSEKVDFIVDGGRCGVGVESTILDLCSPKPRILRPGGMEKERIEEIIGTVMVQTGSSLLPTAPGQLASHYAPRVPLVLFPYEGLAAIAAQEIHNGDALLFFSGKSRDTWLHRWGNRKNRDASGLVRVLSEAGEPIEAAANLFETLHALDAQDLSRILAERAPDIGLGTAINDRLFRAAAKWPDQL